MGVVRDFCESVIRHGFKKIILVNGHGGNTSILDTLIQSLKAKHRVTLAMISITDMATDSLQASRESRSSTITHADGLETSLLLAVDKTKVKLNKIRNIEPSEKSSPKTPLGIKVAWRAEDFSSSGVIGESRKVIKSEGERILSHILEKILEFLKDLD